ncbi:MAG: DNA-directed RNA polymerase subunit beta', partial [Planctomycetota bacterium]
VMGVYFLTVGFQEMPAERKDVRRFKDFAEALTAYEAKAIDLHDWIEVRLDRFSESVEKEKEQPRKLAESRRIVTTLGRLIFNEILPDGMPFYNCSLSKKGAARVIDDTFQRRGKADTIDLLDRMKEVGFRYSTLSGLSFSITDLRISAEKERLIEEAERKVLKVERSYENGAITDVERRNQVLEIWAKCRNDISDRLMETLKNDRRDTATGLEVDMGTKDQPAKAGTKYLNPVYLFADSGARGNKSQMQQLAGMRGLMAKPSGEIIETPIISNFREGLTVLEYFASTHGARKGLADTALKTADSGYLTRKLCDVAQSVTVVEHDCGTKSGVPKRALYKGEEVDVPLRDQVRGRTALQTIVDPRTDRVVVAKNQIITDAIARDIEELGIGTVHVRSPLTCETARGVCRCCYGMDLSTGQPVEQGMAVGIIAAQSIGEPGTQLTMRTFHTGGIAVSTVADTVHKAQNAGTVDVVDCNEVETVQPDGSSAFVALKKNGIIRINDAKGRELEHHPVPYGGVIMVRTGDQIKKGQSLVSWDGTKTPILAEKSGTIKFEDVIEGQTVKVETRGSIIERIVTEHTGEKHPQITIIDDSGAILDFHHLPAKARIAVSEGDKVKAGQAIAIQPKEAGRSADIVGGLPRVTELFEARNPQDPAVLAEISGRVELLSDKRKGKMTIRVVADGGEEFDHHVPQGKHLRVHTGDRVESGDALTEGPQVPADILRIKGEEALYTYMLDEVQNVYRAQGVAISDKHIETILRQMLSKVKVSTPGDTDFLPNQVVERFELKARNEQLGAMLRVEDPGDTDLPVGALVGKDEAKEANALAKDKGGKEAKTRKPKPATFKTLLLGITKASLQSESFLSGASFQETTKVLTEAALSGATDELRGLKENVILGHLIPAGTGCDQYQAIRVAKLVDVPEGDETSDEAYLAEAREEAEELGAESPEFASTISQETLAGLSEALRAGGTGEGAEFAPEFPADEEPGD